MADFLEDTRVEPVSDEPGRYRATLSPKWAVWGPNGGYVAAIALRAAVSMPSCGGRSPLPTSSSRLR